MKAVLLVLLIGWTSCLAHPSTQTSAKISTKAKQTTPIIPITVTSTMAITTTTSPMPISTVSSSALSSLSPTTTTAQTTTTTTTASPPPPPSSSSTTRLASISLESLERSKITDENISLEITNKKPTNGTSTSSVNPIKETRESPTKIRPQIKLNINYNVNETGVRLPEGASAALEKPTKYHYYPHNQHIYLLPECAVQQVCNAVYVRLNFTQPLCACPGRYRDPCSASLNSDDLHTTELVTDSRSKALTLVKTCEPVGEMRECRAPKDWSLLALQNVRTGKSHYLVICRCPDTNILEGPMSHDQPTYASVPGIKVYGMMCTQKIRRGRESRHSRKIFGQGVTENRPAFPWHRVPELLKIANWV
ncbi:uncharacterized protein LOC122860313 [Aphidius gifuensis]|uniref:uncharacterized protein LOC122860313 n=1 Tax=Aphidius gifuensis TaxID=684658 RepID=UPI001CDB76A1|nr:uncharacterized protein LOC122860313 [Aphidius gifuensis]